MKARFLGPDEDSADFSKRVEYNLKDNPRAVTKHAAVRKAENLISVRPVKVWRTAGGRRTI